MTRRFNTRKLFDTHVFLDARPEMIALCGETVNVKQTKDLGLHAYHLIYHIDHSRNTKKMVRMAWLCLHSIAMQMKDMQTMFFREQWECICAYLDDEHWERPLGTQENELEVLANDIITYMENKEIIRVEYIFGHHLVVGMADHFFEKYFG